MQSQNEILAAELDVFIENQMSAQNIPGLSASIVKEGQVVWSAAYGLAHIEESRAVSLETNFTLASISKLFTATACARLWEQGNLDLDANINDYLPIEIVNPNFPDMPITTRQLLQHKSSLHDSESDLQLWDAIGDPIYDLETFCTEYFVEGGSLYAAGNWGNSQPGSSNYWYSNAGYTLLGYIVEQASGMPFNEYCKNEILAPLQMNNAGWFYAEVDSFTIAMPYDDNLQPYGYFSVPEYPAAMLKANVTELSNFLIAYTQGGVFQDAVLFSPNTMEALVPSSMTGGFGWWGVDTWWGDSNGNYWSHGGFMNGVRTELDYYPASQSGLIILTNGEGSYAAIRDKLEEYMPLFQVDSASGINQLADIKFELFPNPAYDKLQVFLLDLDNTEQTSVRLLDLKGTLINELKPEAAKVEMDVSSLTPGFYLLEVRQGEQSTRKKIAVQ